MGKRRGSQWRGVDPPADSQEPGYVEQQEQLEEEPNPVIEVAEVAERPLVQGNVRLQHTSEDRTKSCGARTAQALVATGRWAYID